MKITNFTPGSLPLALGGWSSGVLSLNSNADTVEGLSALYFVQRITANGSNALLNPIANFAAGSNIWLSLDSGPGGSIPSNTIRIHSTATSGGNIITSNGSNGLAAVVNLKAGTNIALGVSGQDITITNTQAAGGGGGGGSAGALVLLEQHTASSSATLDFTTFISSTYDEYVFSLLGVLNATNTVSLLMRVGTGGGPTYDSAANYNWSHVDAYAVNSGVEGSTADTSIGLGGSVDNSHQGVTGTVRLFQPSSAVYKTFLLDTVRWVASGINTPVRDTGVGQYTSATAITAIRFLFSSGNITSGIIRVYGVAKT